MLSARPKIAELVLQLYGRTLHPELFEVYRTKRIDRGRPLSDAHEKDAFADQEPPRDGYTATVQITSAGHVVTWEHRGLVLTEVAASSHQPLPQKRRLMSHRLAGQQNDLVECRGGVSYEVSFGIETVSPKAFENYQGELDLLTLQGASQPAGEESKGGLAHRFESSGRVGLGAMSYVDVQARDRSFRVRAMHTFPDDCAIVKTQSVFRLPPKSEH